MRSSEHYSVLLDESVEALVHQQSGHYADGTFGRGGHSRAILNQLNSDGRLLGVDKDLVAVEAGRALEQQDSRFRMAHGSFAELGALLGGAKLDGIFVDLGVSSPQLDQPERGFSFTHDGPLDMRMDNSTGLSAGQWINQAPAEEIANVLWQFGEERFSRRMAKAIVSAREASPITRTLELAEIIKHANPRWEKHKHPATRAFQAIRIFINNELGDLELLLKRSIELLKPGGRLVVISFHSLEDRMVKRFIKEQANGKKFPKGLPVTEEMKQQTLKVIGKISKAGDEELSQNVRSRSAVMRVAERLA